MVTVDSEHIEFSKLELLHGSDFPLKIIAEMYLEKDRKLLSTLISLKKTCDTIDRKG